MNNLLFGGGGTIQSTTLGTVFANQLVTGGTIQPTSQACIIDLNPPVFAGINFINIGALGQLQTQWLAATDISQPIRYEVYVKSNNPSNLFNVNNIATVTEQLNASIFTLSDGSVLQAGVIYFVGVRAVDGVGNRDNNTVYLSAISSGVVGTTNVTISGIFNIDNLNRLIGTFWVTDNSGVITNPLRLGTASYVIYDKNGNLVPGMSESGIVNDAQGFFEIAPVASVLDLDNNFYAAKVTIAVDGIPVSYNLPVMSSAAGNQYEPRAVFSINALNQLQGTLWITQDSELYSANLGTASYTIYDKNGSLVGISESGITADANGYFDITPVNATAIQDFTHYVVKITINAAGKVRNGTIGITLGE